MALDVTIDVSDFVRVADNLQQIPADFRRRLPKANAALKTETEKAITTVYGPRFLKYWRVSTTLDTGSSLATLTAQTNEPIMVMKEYGTKPHLIRARNAHALHFFMGHQEVFARSVHHPGTKARHGLPELKARIQQQLVYWEDALKQSISSY